MAQEHSQAKAREQHGEHWLRLLFEPFEKMEIDKPQAFELYGSNYLADFDRVTFGGSVSMDAAEKTHKRLEPVWQFLMWEPNRADRDRLTAYLEDNPLNGYHVYLYEHLPNQEEAQVFHS